MQLGHAQPVEHLADVGPVFANLALGVDHLVVTGGERLVAADDARQVRWCSRQEPRRGRALRCGAVAVVGGGDRRSRQGGPAPTEIDRPSVSVTR